MQRETQIKLFTIITIIASLLTCILLMYKAEVAEDARWCDFIENRVNSGEGFTRDEIDVLYRRYRCIDDKYSCPYRSDRFNKLYETHIKPL